MVGADAEKGGRMSTGTLTSMVKSQEQDPQIKNFESWAQENGVTTSMTLPDTPNGWFAAKFPKLPEQYGEAVMEGFPPGKDEGQLPYVQDVSEDFLAATLGDSGTAATPTVFMPSENRFYTYRAEMGIYGEAREARLTAELSNLLLACARDCAKKFNTANLMFKFRDTGNLRGAIERARGLLEVPQEYFENDLQTYIACRNGMLRLADRELLPFAPAYRRRNKLAVDYDPAAGCPLFLDLLMRPALDSEELDLL
jgi:hypothetical protein